MTAPSDHAKRLAEIERRHAEIEARTRGGMDTGETMQAHEDRGDLLDMIRVASEALDDAGALEANEAAKEPCLMCSGMRTYMGTTCPECCLTATLPDLGIAAHGDTAQELAEDVASQVVHAVRDYALAAPESLAEDALVLRAKARTRLGLNGEWPVVEVS